MWGLGKAFCFLDGAVVANFQRIVEYWHYVIRYRKLREEKVEFRTVSKGNGKALHRREPKTAGTGKLDCSLDKTNKRTFEKIIIRFGISRCRGIFEFLYELWDWQADCDNISPIKQT